MMGYYRRYCERRADALAVGTNGKRWIRTWINVFRTETEARVPQDEAQLAQLICEGEFICVGKSHSYNGVQVVPSVTAMMMREGGLTTLAYDPASETVRVGASVSSDASWPLGRMATPQTMPRWASRSAAREASCAPSSDHADSVPSQPPQTRRSPQSATDCTATPTEI